MTGYADLDALLAELVQRVRGILAERFVGAYLQGSFAFGTADEWSDVDFLVVTTELVRDLDELQALHAELHGRETPWAQHLEGSYVPAGILRRVDPQRTPLPFLDNGSSRLEWHPHCNTAVARSVLREHGIALAGPEARELVDPVPPEELRREARDTLRDYADWAHESGDWNGWKQPYLVVTLCRVLRTLACGDVVSKDAACAWALRELDPRWHPLVRNALEVRPEPVRRYYEPADPALRRETIAFADAVSRR